MNLHASTVDGRRTGERLGASARLPRDLDSPAAEIVGEVLAAYDDRHNRPAAPVLGPDRETLLLDLA